MKDVATSTEVNKSDAPARRSAHDRDKNTRRKLDTDVRSRFLAGIVAVLFVFALVLVLVSFIIRQLLQNILQRVKSQDRAS